MKGCQAQASRITRSARSFCPGSNKADGSISRSMASIWIGCPCSPASTSKPRTTDHDLERLRRSPPSLSPCRTWFSRHYRRSPDRLSVHAEGRTGIAPLARNPSALRRGYSAHEPGFPADVTGVTRLIEATVKFRKLAFVGLSKKYQGKVRGNPEDNEVIRAFVGTYSPAIYAYYSSYASAAIREEKRSHTVFKSARVAIGIAAGLFAIGLMVWRPWSSLSATKPNPADQRLSGAPQPSAPPFARLRAVC
jgi:hypothetical protein